MSKNKRSSFYAIIAIAALITQSGCDNPMKKHYDTIYTSEIYEGSGYDLATPVLTLNVPPQLNEISGLSFYNDSLLIAIQDEKAVAYLVNLGNGSIDHELKFGSSGDYEGIALADNSVYAIKSNGQLYLFQLDLNSNDVKSREIETSLTQRNDVEGLAYDPTYNRLLVACKGKGEIGQNEAKGKSVYALDLNTLQLNEKPVISIRKKDLEEIIENDYSTMKLKSKIGPSGIAIHPLSGSIYLLAHDGKALIILYPNGEIQKYIPLNPSLFPQPEGICFNQQGDMFISNEASFSRATIMKFNYTP